MEVIDVAIGKSWKPIDHWYGILDGKRFNSVQFPFNCFYIDSVPAYYFASSLEDIVHRGQIKFSGVQKTDKFSNQASFQTNVVWVGKRPPKQAVQTMLTGTCDECLTQALRIRGTKTICNSKGVFKVTPDKIFITSVWNPKFSVECPSEVISNNADLRNGDQVVFDAVGTQLLPVSCRAAPPGIFMNYKWSAISITPKTVNVTTPKVKNIGGSEFDQTPARTSTCADQPASPKQNDVSSARHDDGSYLVGWLDRLRQDVNEFAFKGKADGKGEVAQAADTEIKEPLSKRRCTTSSTEGDENHSKKIMNDKSVQTISTGDVTFHKVYID